jgi:hypothetical protein
VLDWDGGDFQTLCKIDQELEDVAVPKGAGTEMRESMLVTLVPKGAPDAEPINLVSHE